jgi:hypothetical protein
MHLARAHEGAEVFSATHALFADQSHSIPDNVMALFGLIGAWNYSAETTRSAVGGSPRSGFESASECAN